jgi:hypothetical protein
MIPGGSFVVSSEGKFTFNPLESKLHLLNNFDVCFQFQISSKSVL